MPFDSGFLHTLERLYLLARRHMTREKHGARRSPRRGGSIEFQEYRHYVPGDELRYIDWNIYARHGSLFIKEFSAEESVHVAILVDASASMKFGSPAKLEAAREIAAALGYIGLVSFDSVSVYSFGEKLREHRSFLRGKPHVFDLLRALEEIEAGGKTNLRSVLGTPFPKAKGRSLAILITDFYDPSYAEALRGLHARNFQMHLIHVVAPEELEPDWRGRQMLVDLETAQRREVRVSPELLDRYRQRFSRYCGELERFCGANEMRYVRVRSDFSLEERVMEILKRGGILELH